MTDPAHSTTSAGEQIQTPRPRAIDCFAGEGGATRGLMDAGFHVTAIESSRPRAARNPADEVIVGDVFEVAPDLLATGRFVFGWGSPPCQRYTRGNAANDTSDYPDLIRPTRELFESFGVPYIIENVEDARPHLRNPLMLCGSEFVLRATDDDGETLWLQRHRLFESTLPLFGAGGCRHPKDIRCGGVYGGARSDKDEARNVRKGGYTPASERVQSELLGGVEWMSAIGRRLCIPPLFASFLGLQILGQIESVAA